MGWGSGCYVMDGVIDAAKKHIPDADKRKEFYVEIIKMLENEDWDTQMDAGEKDQEVYDAALKLAHPDWYEDEEMLTTRV